MNCGKTTSLAAFAVAFALCAGIAPEAIEAQTQESFDVTLTLTAPPPPTCAATFDDVTFANLDAGSTVPSNHTESFNLNLDCTGAIAGATATFDGGSQPGAIERQLADENNGGSNLIRYQLRDIAASNPITIGETINLPALVAGTGNDIALEATVTPGQVLPSVADSYSDVVTVTFSF